MRITRLWSFVAFVLIVPASRAQSPSHLVEDIWNSAFLQNSQAGYVHTNIKEIERDGKKLLQATNELKLTVRRNGTVISLRMETGDEETPDGQIAAVFMRQFSGDVEVLHMRGTVKDGKLVVNFGGQGGPMTRTFPWDNRAIGIYRQEQIFRDRKVKPGDRFTYVSFEPTLDHVVVNQVSVKDFEEFDVKGIRKRVLRVDSKPDRVKADNGDVQLPGLTTWLNQDLVPVYNRFELPQLGTLFLVRSTASEAKRLGRPIEVFDNSLIRVQRVIERPNQVESAVFRITVKDEDDVAKTFAQDERQQRLAVDGNTFELLVRARRAPQAVTDSTKPGAEFLDSCQFIDSDNPQIKRFAKQATNGEKDAWQMAKRIERWVHNNMSVSFAENFGPASEVARTLRGDCRQHALLATAMCRAAGIPARTALGLCYAIDRDKGPVMAFHMWTEVWAHGQWLAIDATRGEGSVGATHLKITDSSWAKTQSLTPLLPVIRVLGKLSIEVVSVDGAE
jgi:transglutaminase-like putative cysteine protease